MNAVLRFPPQPSAGITVADVCTAYIDSKKADASTGVIKAATCDKIVRYVAQFSTDFGSVPIAGCRPSDLRRFLAMHPEYESPHTKADAVGSVVTCFRWAWEEERLIDHCPYRRPKGLIPTLQPRSHIEPHEVAALMQAARTDGYRKTRARFRMALFFLWETGCRTCEMREANWRNVDWDRGCIVMDGKTTAKTGQKRLIALSPAAMRLLGFLRRWEGDWGKIFKNGRGRAWDKSTFGRLFRKHARKIGLRAGVTAYSLRHGFCVQGLEAGAGERQIADVMGHSSTRYVGWYGRSARKKVDYLRSTLDKIRGRKPSDGISPA